MSAIFLTGATGFVGRHLVRALRGAGHHVRCLVRPQHRAGHERLAISEAVWGDLQDPATLTEALQRIDAVIHAASITWSRDPHNLIEVNVRGTDHLIQTCRRVGVRRLIYFSSAAVLWPPSPYSESKQQAERLIKQSDLNYTIVRPAQIYGPGDTRGISRLARLIRRSPVILIPASDSSILQPVSVEDITPFILAILFHERSYRKTYALAGASPVSFLSLVTTIERLLGLRRFRCQVPATWLERLARLQYALLRRPAFHPDRIGRLLSSSAVDISEARRDFQFSPRSLEEGLAQTFKAEGWVSQLPRVWSNSAWVRLASASNRLDDQEER